ncbi:MAG: hypothetical protein IPI46_09845 [Bacteroidetes bacterium]|nr:hypothetical protein [Bacteroidota bacterium]
MAAIQITNTNTNLVITNGANVRTINKQVIREISILRGTTIKIDIGGGALRNIFILIADITQPDHVDGPTLLTALNAMLEPIDVQIEADLTALSESINTMQTSIENILPASMQEPSLIDEARENVIYTGFADPGADTAQPRWAIMRTTILEDVIINDWSNGLQTMTAVWDDRTQLAYS